MRGRGGGKSSTSKGGGAVAGKREGERGGRYKIKNKLSDIDFLPSFKNNFFFASF